MRESWRWETLVGAHVPHPLQVSGQPPRVSCSGGVVAQLCPTLCYPMDCSPPDFSVHEISQARLLEWVAIPFSGIFSTRGWNPGLLPCRPVLDELSHQGDLWPLH